MSESIEIRSLSEENFADYVSLTACQRDGGCYCSFWHQKWASMDNWKARQRDAPELNRQSVLDKVRSGFHVGVLAYRSQRLLSWISVGPLPEFYWTWRRVAQLGEAAGSVAGILCITVAPALRGAGLQAKLLTALMDYGRAQGWRAIEGYPFDAEALAKHGDSLAWPGYPGAFEAVGFKRADAHWLSKPGAERSIFRIELASP
jgi:L-amino acid N-acyltransferase YncA